MYNTDDPCDKILADLADTIYREAREQAEARVSWYVDEEFIAIRARLIVRNLVKLAAKVED